MLLNINYQIWYKVCKTIKYKYKLSTNCLMVLNGVYVYSRYIDNNFTRLQLLKFVSYYDNKRIGKYLTVLISHKFIIEAGIKLGRFQMYSISPLGIEVITDLNNSYQDQMYIFCNKYNIEL